MTERSREIDQFLAGTIARDAQRQDLAGDASNRRYERLVQPDGSSLVLMDAPPEKGEDTRPFVQIAEHLASLGLAPPQILAQDNENGFLLIEDLGDDLYARVVQDDPSKETTLYTAAIDVLVTLHKAPLPEGLATYDPALMANLAALAWRWYRRGAGLDYEERAKHFETEFEALLQAKAADASVLIQRDYHAENLLWLPERAGVQKVGLLDFQCAMAGHRAYDLVSLLQDARRDVSQGTEAAMLDHYLAETQQDPEAFKVAYHLLGAQRNLRIVGVFARLSMYSGKPHYVDFLPRVWGYLKRDLAHPALAPIAELVLNDLPEPTADLMQRLKDQCATIHSL